MTPSCPPSNPPSITLASGREISKATLFKVLQAGGWAAAYVVCSFAAEQSIWPMAGAARYVDLGNLRVCCHTRHTSRLPTITSATPLIRDVRRHRADLKRAARAAVVFHGAGFLAHDAACDAAFRFVEIDIFGLYAARAARDPLFLTVYLWPFYSIILFTWASLYFGVNAILELESERANVVNALKLADTARLRALQSNLNPHFLFNALNGIATLVREQDSVTAAAMVDALSTFLRSTLQRLDTPELRVAEEIELIEQYLRIQRYRFGTRLHAVVEAKREALGALIPTLILQPLVENAVRHGVLPREAGGSLWVSVRKELAVLVVSVEDDGPGLERGHVECLRHGPAKLLRPAECIVWCRRKPDDRQQNRRHRVRGRYQTALSAGACQAIL